MIKNKQPMLNGAMVIATRRARHPSILAIQKAWVSIAPPLNKGVSTVSLINIATKYYSNWKTCVLFYADND